MTDEIGARSKRKGPRMMMRRAAALPARYGMSQRRFLTSLEGMVSVLRSHGAVGTFPVTATVLERHPKIVPALDGMEVAVHGLRHIDLRRVDGRRQEEMMKEAVKVLTSHGLRPRGFRAPYLAWNEATQKAVAKVGLLYDSSVPSGWKCGAGIDDNAALKVSLEFYGIRSPGNHLPTVQGSIVVLPVAIPDDEIMIDRLRISSSDILGNAMLHMLRTAMAEGGHLVLQLHPERFAFFRGALDNLLGRARDEGAWIAPLRDVAAWWLNRKEPGPRWPDGALCAVTISGDLDAVTLPDFLLRRLGR